MTRTEAFWENFRLTRGKVRGLSREDRAKHYALVRGGLMAIAIYMATEATRHV